MKKEGWQEFKTWLDMPWVIDNAIEAIRRLPADKVWRITIEPYKKQRSLAMNAYYWGVVLPTIQAHLEERDGVVWSCDDLHEWFRDEFLPKRVVDVGGIPKVIRPSTAELRTGPFSDYLERIIRYCAINMGLAIPEADPECRAGRTRRVA